MEEHSCAVHVSGGPLKMHLTTFFVLSVVVGRCVDGKAEPLSGITKSVKVRLLKELMRWHR